MKLYNPYKWKAPHHLYHGIFFLIFGLFNYYMTIGDTYGDLFMPLIPFWYTIIGFGVFMIIDDIIEHTITESTPLRVFFNKIIKPVLEKLRRK